jgi:hypothetical protein
MVRVDSFLQEINGDGVTFKQIMGRSKTREERLGGYHITLQVHDELVFDFPKGQGTEPYQTNLPIMREVVRLMELGGEGFGIPTPVGCEYHAVSYSEGITVDVTNQ